MRSVTRADLTLKSGAACPMTGVALCVRTLTTRNGRLDANERAGARACALKAGA
jgi:hypothetical protein